MRRVYDKKGMANRVLDAALELGLRHPRGEVAIEVIAEQAGLSFWQAYRCFTNQKNLYRAAVSRLIARIEEDMRSAPASAANVSEAIRLYVGFAAALVQRDAYLQYIQIALRDGQIEPLLEEVYAHRIVAKFRDGLERIVRAGGARHGLVILLPRTVAETLLKSLEAELVLPRLLPGSVEPAADRVEKLVSRLAAQTMGATYALGSQAA